MVTHRIRTIGISILGGNSGVEGRYELGLDEIKAVNEVRTFISYFFGPVLSLQHVQIFQDDLDVVPSSELPPVLPSCSQWNCCNRAFS